MKPSANEEAYFAIQELERRRTIAEERQVSLRAEERARERALHFMKCPKCGVQLEEIAFFDVRIDKCPGCGGIWLDCGELEMIRKKDSGLGGKLLALFRDDATNTTDPPA